MVATTSDENKTRSSYFAMRTRLMAKRKLAETRLAEAHAEVRRIDREIMALERAQRPSLRPPVALRHTRV